MRATNEALINENARLREELDVPEEEKEKRAEERARKLALSKLRDELQLIRLTAEVEFARESCVLKHLSEVNELKKVVEEQTQAVARKQAADLKLAQVEQQKALEVRYNAEIREEEDQLSIRFEEQRDFPSFFEVMRFKSHWLDYHESEHKLCFCPDEECAHVSSTNQQVRLPLDQWFRHAAGATPYLSNVHEYSALSEVFEIPVDIDARQDHRALGEKMHKDPRLRYFVHTQSHPVLVNGAYPGPRKLLVSMELFAQYSSMRHIRIWDTLETQRSRLELALASDTSVNIPKDIIVQSGHNVYLDTAELLLALWQCDKQDKMQSPFQPGRLLLPTEGNECTPTPIVATKFLCRSSVRLSRTLLSSLGLITATE